MIRHKVPIEVSARHIHLSAEDMKILFGSKAELTVKRQISQPGQFAANEMVTIVGPKGALALRVVGPFRQETQVELSITDCRQLGLEPVIHVSGDLANTPGCLLRGPVNELKLTRGVIVPQRHLHIAPAQATKWGLKHGDIISIRTTGERAMTFHHVFVKSRKGVDELSFMLDVDEANAANIRTGDTGECLL